MQRRRFLKTGLGSGLAAGVALSLPTARPLADALSSASFRQSVSRWCFPDLSVSELARAARSIGLRSVELLDPEDWGAVEEHGLVCAMCNGPSTIEEGFNRPANHEKLVPAFKERIRAVAAAGYPNVICFSGNRRPGLSDEEGLAHCARGLQQIMPVAEQEGVTVCMELLNSKIDHPGYMADHTRWGARLCERVGSERFKLLYDIYHMQIMEGDVIRTIRDHHDCIAHYHTAGVPGRHEIDDTQELNYPAIMRAIAETGFEGFVGQEFIPTAEQPLDSLREAYARCDVSA